MTTLKELRLLNNIKPPQVAKHLGIALSSYFEKESGRRGFKKQEIVALCTLFNVRVEDVKNFYDDDTQ